MSGLAALRGVTSSATGYAGLFSKALTAQVVATAVTVGVVEVLADGDADAAAVAAACGTDVDATERLLAALVEAGVIEAAGRTGFRLSDDGQVLRSDHPRSERGLAITQARLITPLATHLGQAVQSGRPVAVTALGRPYYDAIDTDPVLVDAFAGAMRQTAQQWVIDAGWLDRCGVDWEAVRHVVDVGGSSGHVLVALLGRHAHLRGTLFERPEIVELAATASALAPFGERAAAVAGDAFAAVPPPAAGADLFVLSRVVFNWDDEAATTLLRVVASANPAAQVLVLEPRRGDPADDDAGIGGLNDVLALCIGGRTRKPTQHRALFAAADLEVVSSTSEGQWCSWLLAAPR